MPDGDSIIAVIVEDGHHRRHLSATILSFFPSLSSVLSGYVAPPPCPSPTMTIMMTTNDGVPVFLRLPYIVAECQRRLRFVAIRDHHQSFIDATVGC